MSGVRVEFSRLQCGIELPIAFCLSGKGKGLRSELSHTSPEPLVKPKM